MPRFLCADKFSANQELLLSPEQSHHLVKVLRIKPGDKIELFDGRGSLAHAEVLVAAGKQCRVRILSVERFESYFRVTVCFALPKAQALDFIVRRCTEIGIAGFQPLTTEHSMKRSAWNESRWEKVVAEVCKQCESLFVPHLGVPRSLDDWLSQRNSETVMILCDEKQRNSKADAWNRGLSYDLLIGAEGGWSAAEVQKLQSAGAVPFGLGQNRLRTETAALVCTTLVKERIGEI